MKQSRIHVYSVPEGVTQYTAASLYCGEQKIDLYNVKANNSQSWNGLAPNRVDTGVAIFRLEGKATLTVKTTYAISSLFTKVRPLSYGIVPTFDIANNSFSFEISSAGKYVIEPNGERIKAIHLFVNTLEDDGIDHAASNVIYFGPGLHTAESDSRLANGSTVTLQSGQIAYLDYGAVVRGRFLSYETDNAQIRGGGIIDDSVFPRVAGQSSGNTAFVPIDFDYCTNITFKDFTVLDPAGWTVNCYFDTDSAIDNINIISSRSNGDGVTLQSCQNFYVSNVFVRSWDDSLVVKNYPQWNNKSQHGTTKNITFYNCTLWTDLAQSMEIGYETVGTVFEDVRFENITVLHNYHKPVMSIHNGNDADIKRITYKDITVEDASMGGGDTGDNRQLIQLANAWSSNWSDQHAVTPLGHISDISIANVNVLNGNDNIPIATLNGKEGCNLWQHASLQFQPSTGVAYGIYHYMKVSHDDEFLLGYGLEMLLEISKFLLSRGQWNQDGSHFGFYSVMGPDEFKMMVNNNTYTNYMAKKTFEYTLSVIKDHQEDHLVAAVLAKTGVTQATLKQFQTAADKMLILYDEKTKLFEENEGFYDLPHIDPDSIPVTEFPLYAHWSYDRIYRSDLIKQPDVLMFMFLHSSAFSLEQKKANYEFYEPKCIHESSLSPSIHSIFASELGKEQEALDFFGFATRMDLDDYNRNAGEGLHTTSIAAAWMNIVYGFGGLRSDGDTLILNPSIPSIWPEYRFRFAYQGCRFDVTVDKKQVAISKDADTPIALSIYGKKYQVGKSLIVKRI